MDSAYSGWRDIVLARADLVVALDYPRWLSLRRLVQRTIRRCVTREQVCNGNTESFRRVFTRDSIILWHFTAFPRKREALERMKADPDMPPVISFRRPADLDAWIGRVGRDARG